MYRRLLTVAAMLGVAAGFLPTALTAQSAEDIQTRRTVTTEFGGALGTVMKLMPGVDGEQVQVLSIDGQAPLSRTDDDNSSTIMDYATGTIIVLDHDAKEYYRFTIDDMMGSLADMRAQAASAGEVPAGPPPAAQDAGVEYEVSFDMDRPGDSREVLGARVELHRMVVRADPVRAEDVDPEQLPSYAMVTDLWMADDYPGADAHQRLGKAASATFRDQAEELQETGEALQQAFMVNGALQESYANMAEEMAKLEGVALEQTMSFVVLLPDADLDVDRAINEPLAGPDIDLGKAAREGAKGAIENAVRGRLGRLGGALGRRGRNNDDEKKAEDQPEMPPQAVVLRVHDRMTGVEEGPLPVGWFEPPADYTEKASPFSGAN